MVHKLALAVGGIVSGAMVAVALAASGFGPVAPVPTAMDIPVFQAAVAPTPQPTTVTDNVYVAPTPEPRVIRITKPAVVRPTQQPVLAVAGGEADAADAAEHDNEGNGD
jgi:hypothetical protein